MRPLRFQIWSDYLCPWCYLAAERWQRIEESYEGRIELRWCAYLLRPTPRSRSEAALEKFRVYTQSWRRPAAEIDAPSFVTWQGAEGPPTHSVPAHLIAKAARDLGHDAFDRVHRRLLRAYFRESRDVSDPQVLEDLWLEVGLPREQFASHRRRELLDEVLDDHNRALEAGATGVPAVQLEGNDAVIVGAHPEDLYRGWIERLLSRAPAEGERAP